MRKTLLFATALVLAAGAANAASMSKEGVIKTLDRHAQTLTLASGDTFYLGKNVHANALKVGEKVKVSYQVNGKRWTADQVMRIN